jgi:hypothetical protein
MIENEENEVQTPSVKRQVAAAAIAGVVGITLQVGAGFLINKLSKKIVNQIAPENETEEN